MPERVLVLGAGAWGTVLANLAARAGAHVALWTRDPDHAAEMAATGVNARHLPGVPLGLSVRPTASLSQAEEADLILLAVPTQALRQVCESLTSPPRSCRIIHVRSSPDRVSPQMWPRGCRRP